MIFTERLKERLREFWLNVLEEKSRIIPFDLYPYLKAERKGRRLETFEFLGFTHYCTKGRKGYFRLGRKTSKERFSRVMREINQWLKCVRNRAILRQWWEMLKVKIEGHYRYYGISGNMPGIKAFYKEVVRFVFKWVNRRNQKKSYNWAKFLMYLTHNILPKPRIYHVTYTLSGQRYVTEEPCVGNLHARFYEGH